LKADLERIIKDKATKEEVEGQKKIVNEKIQENYTLK